MNLQETLQNDLANHPNPVLAMAVAASVFAVIALVMTGLGGLTMQLALRICGAGTFSFRYSVLVSLIANVVSAAVVALFAFLGSGVFVIFLYAATAGAIVVWVTTRSRVMSSSRAYVLHQVLNGIAAIVIMVPVGLIGGSLGVTESGQLEGFAPTPAVHSAIPVDANSNPFAE